MYEHDVIHLRKLEAFDLNDLVNLKRESWLSTHQITIVNDSDQRRWLKSLEDEDVNTPKNLVLTASQ